MKSFPFGSAKYKQYRNTFLQNVIITFTFNNAAEDLSKLDDDFKDYIQTFFGITPNCRLSEGLCSITKKDKSLSFAYAKDSVNVQISGQNYITFSETAIPNIFKLRDFFNKVVKIEKLNSISIRKINVWNFKNTNKQEIRVEDLRDLVFSKKFLSALSTEHLDEIEKSIPHFSKCSYSEDEKTLTIRTALLPPTAKDDFHHLILDTTIDLHKSDKIKVDQLADSLMDLNSELFDCYHWCISKYVLNVMDSNPDENK